MADGLSWALLAAAVFAFVLSLVIVRAFLPAWAAVAVVAVKVAVPLVYFSWFYDGSWTFLDDAGYYRQGAQLLAMGYDPLSVLLRGDGLRMLFFLSLGPHILYGWWNLLAEFLLGEHYYAGVFLNLPVTFAAAWLLQRLARRGGASPVYAQGLAVFFLLHWELLPWSSFLNLKDILVLGLALLALHAFYGVVDPAARGRRILQATLLVTALFFLQWIRFYTIALLFLAFAIWLVLVRLRGAWRVAALATLALAAVGTIGAVPPGRLALAPAAVAFGMLKALITPRPWHIEPAYTFLTYPMIVHWLLLPVAALGAWKLWRDNPAGALVLTFLAVAMVLNGLAPEFQGPRNRVYVLFGWAWIQYHGLHVLLRPVLAGEATVAPRPPGAAAGLPVPAGSGA